MDTEHYVRLSDRIMGSGGLGVPENDDLEGARTGLRTGYGQTKWVCEKLIMEAGKRGLKAHIIRPGYVVGHSKTAGELIFSISLKPLTTPPVTNTDDFIWRLVKGCIQLQLVPDINNTINMVPVDTVALCTSLSAITPAQNITVLHIAARPRVTFNDLFGSLSLYGYDIQKCDYVQWRQRLEHHVLDVQDNALFPLLHFVLDDLPRSTKAPELDDSNTQRTLDNSKASSEVKQTVDQETTGMYISWLINAGFLGTPPRTGSIALPVLTGSARAVGRSGQ